MNAVIKEDSERCSLRAGLREHYQGTVNKIKSSGVLGTHLSWPAPPENWSLDRKDVHVWGMSLEASPAKLRQFASLLAPAERERAARYHFDLHRNRFIVGRALLRTILGEYLETDPAKLDFVYGGAGKPSLAPAFEASRLKFNLAHSENLALLTVTREEEIGVDVEKIRPLKDAAELVARFFSGRENAAFQKLPPDERPAAFFNLWTRKEAWLKATGEGIAHSLARLEVSFLPGEPAQLFSIQGSAEKAAAWSLHHLVPAKGFAGALAIKAQKAPLNCWHWREASG